MIFANPVRFDSIYAFGFSILYLTPAWAAKLQTLSILFSSKTFSNSELLAKFPK